MGWVERGGEGTEAVRVARAMGCIRCSSSSGWSAHHVVRLDRVHSVSRLVAKRSALLLAAGTIPHGRWGGVAASGCGSLLLVASAAAPFCSTAATGAGRSDGRQRWDGASSAPCPPPHPPHSPPRCCCHSPGHAALPSCPSTWSCCRSSAARALMGCAGGRCVCPSPCPRLRLLPLWLSWSGPPAAAAPERGTALQSLDRTAPATLGQRKRKRRRRWMSQRRQQQRGARGWNERSWAAASAAQRRTRTREAESLRQPTPQLRELVEEGRTRWRSMAEGRRRRKKCRRVRRGGGVVRVVGGRLRC